MFGRRPEWGEAGSQVRRGGGSAFPAEGKAVALHGVGLVELGLKKLMRLETPGEGR